MTGEQIDAGHQGQGTVTFILVIARLGWAGARQWRSIRRGRTNRLDSGFLVVRDDGEAVVTAAVLTLALLPFRPQHRHLPADTEDLGHLGLELWVALFQVVAHYDTEWLIRTGRALDPERYFIIIPNMLGNGLSSSPSKIGPPHDRGRFPGVTVADNVRMQHRLLTEQLGIERTALVYGWSMGGQQAYHWAALYPEIVERIAVVCGSARNGAAQLRFPGWHQIRADGGPGMARRLF